MPNYTVAELENDMKITLYACYNDVQLLLWEHFMYNDSSKKQEDISNRKQSQERLFDQQKYLKHVNSWMLQDDKRIHPIINDTGFGFGCSNNVRFGCSNNLGLVAATMCYNLENGKPIYLRNANINV